MKKLIVGKLGEGNREVDLTDEEISDRIREENEWEATRRVPKPIGRIVKEIAALPSTQRTKLLNAIMAEFLQNHPDFAQKLGIPIRGEEPPTIEDTPNPPEVL